MATIPTADELGRLRHQPSTAVAQYRAGTAEGEMERAGHVVERTVERVNNVLDQTADTQARGALAELKRHQNQLTVGEDGYARLQNEAATSPGVVQKYDEMHKSTVESLGAKLNPLARKKFIGMAQRQAASFQAGLLTHIMREDLASRGAVYQANVDVAAETAGINYNNPQVLLEERANLDRTVANHVQKNGIKDPALVERTLQDARGKFHQSVINAYVENEQVHNAQAYFDAIKQEMTPERAKAVNNMLKPEIANQIGRNVSDKMYQMHLSGASESDILEEQLKLTEGKPKEALIVANQLYRARVNALDQDRTKASGSILLSAFNGGPGMTDPRLRQIDMQDPQLGLQVREKLQAIQKRRAADAAAGDKTPARKTDMIVYGQLAERIREGGATDEDIIQFADKLKDTDIKSLMSLRAQVNTQAGKYKINTALINAGMPRSANTTEEKQAYKGFVESKLQEWKEANPGKFPTPEEEKAIIRSATEEHVVIGRVWNSSVMAFEAGEKKTYPKSFGTLMKGASDDDILAAYAFTQQIRARRKKTDPNWTDAELVALWQKQNQRGNQ